MPTFVTLSSVQRNRNKQNEKDTGMSQKEKDGSYVKHIYIHTLLYVYVSANYILRTLCFESITRGTGMDMHATTIFGGTIRSTTTMRRGNIGC